MLNARPEAVRRYQSLSIECQQRAAAIAELERLLPASEEAFSLLSDSIARVLEAVVTIDREAFVHRLRESGELEQLRSRFERLRAMTNTHGADIDEWSRRVGRPVLVPRIAFSWPPEPVWPALLGAPAEAPKLVWDDDRRPPSA